MRRLLLLALTPFLFGFSFSSPGADGWESNETLSAVHLNEIAAALNASVLVENIGVDVQAYSSVLDDLIDGTGDMTTLTVTQSLTSTAYEVHAAKRYVVNNQTEFETAVDACGSGIGGGSTSTGCHIDLACGEFAVSSTLAVGGTELTTAKYGVTIEGCGGGSINTADGTIGGTVLKWSGGASPVLVMSACSFCTIKNLGIDGNDTATAGIVFAADTVAPAPSSAPMSFSTIDNVTIRDVNGYGVSLSASDGEHQIDSIAASRLSVRDSVGGWFQESTQSVHITIDQSEFAGITGPSLVRVDGGEIIVTGSFLSASVASQVGLLVSGQAKAVLQNGRLELRTDSIGVQGTSDLQNGDANVIRGNAFVVLGTGVTCVDWDRVGHLTFSDNAILASGTGVNAGCILNAENSVASGFTGGLTVTSIGNSHRDVYEAADFTNYGAALDYSQLPWALGANTYLVNIDKIGRENASGPNSGWGVVHWSQIEGMPEGFEDGTDDGAEGPSGTGDLTSIGSGSLGTACTTGDCFEGTGAEDNITVTGDFEVNLDSDANGTNEFRVVNGGGTEVFSVDETGTVTANTGFVSNSGFLASTVTGTTSLSAGSTTSDGNLNLYNDDAGGDGLLILTSKAGATGVLALPVSGAADGLPLVAESATSSRWGGSINLGSGTIRGSVPIVTTTDGTETATMLGEVYIADHATASSNTTYTLPSAVAGMSGCIYDHGQGTGGIILDPEASDRIMLGGVLAAVNENINSPGVAGDGANGDYICLVAIDADVWASMGTSGTWVEATP